jgi:hypothetical protein
MAITYHDNLACFDGAVTVEEAEGLLAWLAAHPHGEADLADCTHCHAAILQLLMAARPAIGAAPKDSSLAGWLRSALPQMTHTP